MRIILGGNSDIGKAIMGTKITRDECDVTDYEQVFLCINKYNATEVVNCAGYIFPSSIAGSNIANWVNEININLIASYYIAKACSLLNIKMVFIGSTSGLRGRGGWSGYCASKAGLISLVQSLAEENEQAWCINPSRTETKMRKKLFPNEDTNTLLKPSDIAMVVEQCFDGVYDSGSNITVSKNKVQIQVNK